MHQLIIVDSDDSGTLSMVGCSASILIFAQSGKSIARSLAIAEGREISRPMTTCRPLCSGPTVVPLVRNDSDLRGSGPVSSHRGAYLNATVLIIGISRVECTWSGPTPTRRQ